MRGGIICAILIVFYFGLMMFARDRAIRDCDWTLKAPAIACGVARFFGQRPPEE